MTSRDLIMLKLGGSLITDKRAVELVRQENLEILSIQIAEAINEDKSLKGRLIIGHGSGSFGHYMASKYGTRKGVSGPEQWMGFARVSDSALRLNRIVVASLLSHGIPAISVSPLSSATTSWKGQIETTNLWTPLMLALDNGLVPVIHGDVVFDQTIGGSIASTEELIKFLSKNPSRPDCRVEKILLAVGEVDGVLDQDGKVIPEITSESYLRFRDVIKGCQSRDVTGGMASKVENMIDLCSSEVTDKVVIFGGTHSGILKHHLLPTSNSESPTEEEFKFGTLIIK